MIIFEKFGDGQAERRHYISVSFDHSMGSSTLLTLPILTAEGSPAAGLSQMGKARSCAIVATPSALVMRGRNAVSLRGARVAARRPLPPLSNRELDLLDRRLSYCKQRLATVSNRELWTIRSFAKPPRSVPDRTVFSRLSIPVADCGLLTSVSLLPGTAQYVEYGVTPTKQTIATFLPGSRFAHSAGRKLNGEGRKYFAKASSSQALSGHGARLWTQSGARYNAYTNHNEITSFRSER
jgi:hypothetical protein